MQLLRRLPAAFEVSEIKGKNTIKKKNKEEKLEKETHKFTKCTRYSECKKECSENGRDIGLLVDKVHWHWSPDGMTPRGPSSSNGQD